MVRRIVENIGKIVFILFLICWVIIVFVDYFRFSDGKNPKFCLKETTKKYSDGEVYICTGLGYKSFRYERKCKTGTAFGPFFISEKKCAGK